MKIVSMYTDGACSGNQNEENVGGWGCILEFAGREKELWDGEVNTTNNRMELSAPIAGLSALKEKLSGGPGRLSSGTKTGSKMAGRRPRKSRWRTGSSGKSCCL